MIRPLAILLLAIGCVRPPVTVDAAGSPSEVLERARLRPTPDPVRARLHLKLRSRPLDLSSGTGGVLIVDRPGKGHLAILGPLGGPVATFTSDGTALAVAIPRDKRLLSSPRAHELLLEATGGMLGLDAVVGMTLGDLPFDGARVKSRKPREDGAVDVVLTGPNASRVEVLLDGPTATPRALSIYEKTGRVLIRASFDPFEARDDGTFLPTRVELEVPAFELELELRFKSWEILEQVPPVFDTAAPDGWTVEPLAQSLSLPGISPLTDGHP